MKRTWFMQWLLNQSHTQMTINAISRGSIVGSWEDAIVKLIKQEMAGTYKTDAERLLQMADGDYTAAATICLESYIPTHNNDDLKLVKLGLESL